eukprot:scaffold33764_cov55-Phaeocystis_antarctica.AAC.3
MWPPEPRLSCTSDTERYESAIPAVSLRARGLCFTCSTNSSERLHAQDHPPACLKEGCANHTHQTRSRPISLHNCKLANVDVLVLLVLAERSDVLRVAGVGP